MTISKFVNRPVVADSTDFQQTLDTFATAVANAHTNFDTALQAMPYDVRRTQMIADRDSIVTQLSLENSNITSLRTYTETLTDNQAYAGLAEDTELRELMAKVAQNKQWQTYFEDYENNLNNLNPIYTTDSRTRTRARSSTKVLAANGLPDVTDLLICRLWPTRPSVTVG
jgi:hypothetical protein